MTHLLEKIKKRRQKLMRRNSALLAVYKRSERERDERLRNPDFKFFENSLTCKHFA